MSAGVLLIAYFVALSVMGMCLLYQSLRGHHHEPTSGTEGGFALQKGQTIVGVRETAEGMYFHIGDSVMDEKNMNNKSNKENQS
jgi:hypothetical protein